MAASTLSNHSESSGDEEGRPNQRTTLIRSVTIASVVMLFGVGIPLSLYMESWVNGFAVGAFTALWGGPGFGLMAGMALHTLHTEIWEERHGIVH